MKLQSIKKAFTLIELLVVITIIGILATWATTVYTSQIQKARDSNRVTDIKALQWGVEQLYADTSEYPSTADETTATLAECEAGLATYNISCLITLEFMTQLPADEKAGNPWANGSPLNYTYNVANANSGVDNQKYELSAWFEAVWSVTSKAANSVDDGDDASRMEVWPDRLNISSSNTIVGGVYTQTTSCEALNATQADDNAILLSWNCAP